jgi:hypothetical protein
MKKTFLEEANYIYPTQECAEGIDNEGLIKLLQNDADVL